MTDELNPGNKPWSEAFYLAAREWADKENAAKLLEETKSAVLSQRQQALGADLPVNRAEMIVKASPEWMDHLKKIAEARYKANLAWIKVEAIKMKFNEWNSSEANTRLEAKMMA